ncbi:sulfotransferase domain-containing protein [Methylotuvimicrobium sp. KM2]|uniref:sulfotransferase domain-containing protein n=1 Tax=Methylotuvimicrobium sp. KM2 TaxID=3133976 RepID=UPI003100CF59
MESKKTIFIHVGYPKTGTTTLQNHFFPKIEDIQYLGKFYDKENKFVFQDELIAKIIFNNEVGSQVSSVLDDRTIKNKAILSEEAFLFDCLRISRVNGKDYLPSCNNIAMALRRAFDENRYDVKILISIRKQDDMIASLYAQSYTHYYCKYNKTDTFLKFIDLFLQGNGNHAFKKALDYNDVVSQYKKIFGDRNIHVIVFEQLQQNPQEFYNNLCDILGVDGAHLEKELINKQENIRSTSQGHKEIRKTTLLDKLYFFKEKYLPIAKIKLTKRQKEWLRSIVLSKNDHVSKSISMDSEQRKAILGIYENANKKLSQSFKLSLGNYGYYKD